MTETAQQGFRWTDVHPSDPDYWPSVRRNAMAHHYAGRVPTWDGDHFLGFRNEIEDAQARADRAATEQAAMRRADRAMERATARGKPRTDVPTIRAIQAQYAGCHFRSRLEARWAVFFDQLGIEWEYEKQGFDLPSGRYLPDFWLPTVGDGIWFEVKGIEPSKAEEALAWELAVATKSEVVISAGDIPWPDTDRGVEHPALGAGRSVYFPDSDTLGSDFGHEWCVCPATGQIGIEFSGIGSRITGDRRGPDTYNADHPRLMAAYKAARSARFEHGETPVRPGAAA